MAWWIVLLVAGYLLTLLLIPWILLKPTVHPSAAVAWILTVLLLPYLGAVLALVFGINRVERHRTGKRKASEEIGRRLPEWSIGRGGQVADRTPLEPVLASISHRLAGRWPTAGNRSKLLTEMPRAFETIEEMILSARHYLHIEFYIWRADGIGVRLRDLLIRKAREGVAVRFLYDGVGSLGLTRKFLKPMVSSGVHVALFLPGRRFHQRWSINLRNHRKLVLVDGQTALTGGMNIGDEYLGRDPGYGNWRDTQIHLRGPCVQDLQQVFVEDWYYATGEDLSGEQYFPEPQQYGDQLVQTIADGPENSAGALEGTLFTAISQAREKILLATSYFVPPDSLCSALENAARRGVRTRLLVARRGNFWITLLAGRSYFDRLLAAGVEIHEYTGGFFHGKTLTVDGVWSLVGTPNFDMRSLMLNFEIGMAIFDRRTAKELEEQFETDLRQSEMVALDSWSERPAWSRLQENFCRLFAPVL